MRPAKTQISLGIRPVWSESSLCAPWVAKELSFLHANSEDSDQTGRMPRMIWVFAGRTVILLVLSCRVWIVSLGTNDYSEYHGSRTWKSASPRFLWNFFLIRTTYSSNVIDYVWKVNEKVQGVPLSQATAYPWEQKEEKTDKNWRVQNTQTNAREAHRPAPSSPCEVITMLNRTEKKHEDKEQGMTQHETPRTKNHKATQTINHTRTTALERSVA